MSENRQHVVVPGDCMASIAAQSGLPWQTIWDSPDNKPLKELRKNPFTLLPGDKVTLPPANARQEACPTDKKYKFVVKTTPIHINLVILDENEKPFANQPYTLDVDGQKFSGNTGGNGAIQHLIPPAAKEGCLVVGPIEKRREYYLKLGHIHPIETISGGQARLYDLGYYDGEANGQLNGHTRSALMIFQKKHKLPVDGEYTKAVQDKLKALFGS